MTKIFQTVSTPIQTCVAMKCDRCGAVHDDRMDIQEYLSWKMTCGYANHTFGDMNRVEIDLCQDCTKEVLGPWIRVTTCDDFCRAFDDSQGVDSEEK
jgi:hypothetical protein